MATHLDAKAISPKLNSSADFHQWWRAVEVEADRLGMIAPFRNGIQGNAIGQFNEQGAVRWRNLKSAMLQSLGEAVRNWLDAEPGVDAITSNAAEVGAALREQWAHISLDEQMVENASVSTLKWIQGDGQSTKDIRSFVADLKRKMQRLPGIYVPQEGVPGHNALNGHILRHLKKSLPPGFNTALEILSARWGVEPNAISEQVIANLLTQRFQELVSDGKIKTVSHTNFTIADDPESMAWLTAGSVNATNGLDGSEKATGNDGKMLLSKNQVKKMKAKARKEGFANATFGKGKGKNASNSGKGVWKDNHKKGKGKNNWPSGNNSWSNGKNNWSHGNNNWSNGNNNWGSGNWSNSWSYPSKTYSTYEDADDFCGPSDYTDGTDWWQCNY